MKKITFPLLVATLLSFIPSASNECLNDSIDGLLIFNGTPFIFHGSIRLHSSCLEGVNGVSYLGDLPMNISPFGNLLITNNIPMGFGITGIPFNAMAPYTDHLTLHGNGAITPISITELQNNYKNKFKWWCIKGGTISSPDNFSSYIGLYKGIQDSLIGFGYSPINYDMVVKDSSGEVFRRKTDYMLEHEQSLANHSISISESPFGGPFLYLSYNN